MRQFFTGGLPDDKLLARIAAAVDGPISRQDLAARAGISQQRLSGALDLLEAAGAVLLGPLIEPVAGGLV